MTKRRTEIIFETERLLVAERRTTTRVWCERCAREVWADAAGTEANFSDGTARGAGPRKPGAEAATGDKSRAKE